MLGKTLKSEEDLALGRLGRLGILYLSFIIGAVFILDVLDGLIPAY